MDGFGGLLAAIQSSCLQRDKSARQTEVEGGGVGDLLLRFQGEERTTAAVRLSVLINSLLSETVQWDAQPQPMIDWVYNTQSNLSAVLFC